VIPGETGPALHFGIDCPEALARVFPQFPEKTMAGKRINPGAPRPGQAINEKENP